jgi:hypothetical protein
MFNFVFALNQFMKPDSIVDMDLRILLAKHCGSTKPEESVNEAINSLIIKLEELKKLNEEVVL